MGLRYTSAASIPRCKQSRRSLRTQKFPFAGPAGSRFRGTTDPRTQFQMKTDLVITRSSALPLETIGERLATVSVSHKFGVLATHNLRERMISNGVPFDRECRVIEVCNPQQARDVLSQAIEISTALPRRISVYEERGRTILATNKPPPCSRCSVFPARPRRRRKSRTRWCASWTRRVTGDFEAGVTLIPIWHRKTGTAGPNDRDRRRGAPVGFI